MRSIIEINSSEKIDDLLCKAMVSAEHAHKQLQKKCTNALNRMEMLKFNAIGMHPIDHHEINLVEQINQFWTYLTALHATRHLLKQHPLARGFKIAPGAHAGQPFDIESCAKNLVAAETFAAVNPGNNRKIHKDIEKLVGKKIAHRYVYFVSPKFHATERHPKFEKDGIEVWSISFSKVTCNLENISTH